MQSLVATLMLVPIWLSIRYFDRNCGVRPEIFLVWYFIGVVATTGLYRAASGVMLVPSWIHILAIMGIGLTLGAGANMLIFRAVAEAPNPGLPLAIMSTANVGVFLLAVVLSRTWPEHFASVEVDWWKLFGVLLAELGVAIIVLRGV